MFYRLKNVPSVENRKRADIGMYSREEDNWKMVAAVGGSSERAWHRRISSLVSSALSGRE